MLLPMGRPHDGGNGRSFWSVQHREHASLLRARPAVMERASLSLNLAGGMPLASGLPRRNGNPLAGGDCSGGRSRDFASGNKAAVVLLGRGHRLVRSIDGCEASACDAKRDRSAAVIVSPDRERATGLNLFQQAGADELIDDLSGGSALNVRRQFNAAIFALRSRGQNDELGIGESYHRDPPFVGTASFAATAEAPPRPFSRWGRIPKRVWRPEQSQYRSVCRRMPVLSG